MVRRPSGPIGLQQAFDEARFGAERTLNLRVTLPTVAEATRRAEQWLRERQMAKAGEVLVITGRGAGSEGGVSVVREAVQRLFTQLRKTGVIRDVYEHTAGSFVVTLAPVTALFEAPRRTRRESGPIPVVVEPGALRGLQAETLVLLRRLADRALDGLGVQVRSAVMIEDEMLQQFAALGGGVPDGPDREARLRAAMQVALDEFDDRKFGD
jgi:Smr domain